MRRLIALWRSSAHIALHSAGHSLHGKYKLDTGVVLEKLSKGQLWPHYIPVFECSCSGRTVIMHYSQHFQASWADV